ncbi:hypothetical protein [Protofrankia symbiont of Coriaria ruscifolia]|uniref:Uncharacterized protein n=1 Tax=Candidatus Protofrankia californiensis TaxID=1839754 RepID=A0A1C3P6B2_9ACTN|nr:hypothetical protein [Protofrankia symbiont of Coriaria ruscifolia]SBW25375.1 hypothetical protein FDG2_4528 [Candidatus Protofrankia californiensis]
MRNVNLRAFGDHRTVVAEDTGRVVGHVMFTRSLLDAPRRLVEVQVLSPLALSGSAGSCATRSPNRAVGWGNCGAV